MSITFSPPAIIFINTDLVQQIQDVFVRQLYITQVMDASTFDGYVAADGYYARNIHIDGYRILVLRDLFDHTNRSLADIVLFAKAGMVSVLSNNYGPPGITLPIDRVYLTALINLQKYQQCRSSGHGYEQSWNWEPTNNSDFNPWNMDAPIDIEPVGDTGNPQINHIVEPFPDFDPDPFGSEGNDDDDD